MIIWLLSYGIIIIPIILLYAFSFFETLYSLLKHGKRTSKTKLAAHGIVLTAILIFKLYNSEVFKSDIIMTATLKDDLSHFRLVLRENGNVENQVNGMFGFTKTFKGEYKIEDNLIVFTKRPYDNNFIPDTLLIDKSQGVIFKEKDSDGNFRTEKEWLNHFIIEK